MDIQNEVTTADAGMTVMIPKFSFVIRYYQVYRQAENNQTIGPCFTFYYRRLFPKTQQTVCLDHASLDKRLLDHRLDILVRGNTD